MFAFIIRRVLQAILVMFIISFIGFALKQNVGDPVREITGISVSAAEREAIREKLGLNDPFPVQYGRFLKGALQGDVNRSSSLLKVRLTALVTPFLRKISPMPSKNAPERMRESPSSVTFNEAAFPPRMTAGCPHSWALPQSKRS